MEQTFYKTKTITYKGFGLLSHLPILLLIAHLNLTLSLKLQEIQSQVNFMFRSETPLSNSVGCKPYESKR